MASTKGERLYGESTKGAKWKIPIIGVAQDFTAITFLVDRTLFWKVILELTILSVGWKFATLMSEFLKFRIKITVLLKNLVYEVVFVE